MAANSIIPDQVAPNGAGYIRSRLIFVHNVCNIGYQSTPADEKGDICCEWREKG